MLEPHSRSERDLFLSVLIIIPLAGMGIDIYVPSLPSIASYFVADPRNIKLTLSLYLVGLAVGQLAWGGALLGNVANRLLLNRYRTVNIMLVACVVMALFSTALLVASYAWSNNLIGFMAPVIGVAFFGGLLFPNGLAKTMQLYPHAKGAVAASLGFSVMFGTTCVSVITSQFHESIFSVLALGYFVLALVAFSLFFCVVQKGLKSEKI